MTLRPPNADALVRWIGGADQQLRQDRASAPFSWNNVRWETNKAATTTSGVGYVVFSAPFDHACFIVICQQQPDVGIPSLVLSVSQWTSTQFTLSIEGGYSGTFRINYIALGF